MELTAEALDRVVARRARRGRRRRRRHDRGRRPGRRALPRRARCSRSPASSAASPRRAPSSQALDPDVRVRGARSTTGAASPSRPARSRALEGPARAILTGERTALNLLGRLCGIATLTRALRRRRRRAPARRSSTRARRRPGLRALEKYAVRCGGGTNHRFGLDDAILLKENHLRIAGGIAPLPSRARAQRACRSRSRPRRSTRSREALDAGVDRILLDNMSPSEVRRGRRARRRPRAARGLRRHLARDRPRLRRDRRRLHLGRRADALGALAPRLAGGRMTTRSQTTHARTRRSARSRASATR